MKRELKLDFYQDLNVCLLFCSVIMSGRVTSETIFKKCVCVCLRWTRGIEIERERERAVFWMLLIHVVFWKPLCQQLPGPPGYDTAEEASVSCVQPSVPHHQ